MSIKSALNFTRSHLTQLCEDVELRRTAISTDADILRRQITALEEDLKHLELSKIALQQVKVIQNRLQQQVETLLSQFSQYEPPYDLMEEFGSLNQVRFDDRSSAEDFQDRVCRRTRQEVDKLLDKAREEIIRLTEKARNELIEFLQRETKPIIQRAQQRLNAAFNLELTFTPPKLSSYDIEVVTPRRTNIESKSESWTDWETRYERRWYTLWLWEHEKRVPVTRVSQYFVVARREVIDLFKESIAHNVSGIKRKTYQYLAQDFDEEIAAFFKSLDDYLTNYRNNLKQALEDQKLSDEQQTKLLETLNSLVPQANEQIEQAKTYLSEIDRFIRDK